MHLEKKKKSKYLKSISFMLDNNSSSNDNMHFHEIMEDRVDVFAKIINATIVDITIIDAMVDAIRGCGRV